MTGRPAVLPLVALAAVVLALGGPVVAGLVVALARADWPSASALPGLGRAMALSLGPGFAATALSTGLAGLILALAPPRHPALWAALLALPHAALALGLALLVAPSGPLARLAAPLLGWSAPPDLMIPDAQGVLLTLGLVLKETPFLVFLGRAAQGPEIARMGLAARPFGHGRALRFALVEWPPIYNRIRLPVAAVLAYGMTTVDMGTILGPGLPAPLSVEVARAATRADLDQGTAAALGLMQLALVLAALVLWRGVERLGRALADLALARGTRAVALDAPLVLFTRAAKAALGLIPLSAVALLALWSVTLRWPFAGVPRLSLAPLMALPGLAPLAGTSLLLALASTAAALALSVALLHTRPAARIEPLIWAPLILPQVAFLPGVAQALIPLGLGPWPATVAGHLTLVLPYLWLTLAGPWRAFDARQAEVAATLAPPRTGLIRLRLPSLKAPLAAALSVGFAASTGQYLATLLLSGGRLPTLTTEAVALATGPDRARIAALALAQAALPLLAFALAARVKPFPSRVQSLTESP